MWFDIFANWSSDLFQSAKMVEAAACYLCEMLFHSKFIIQHHTEVTYDTDRMNVTRVNLKRKVISKDFSASAVSVYQTKLVQSYLHWAGVFSTNTSLQRHVYSPAVGVWLD